MRWLVTILALLPALVHAEGGLISLDCTVVDGTQTMQFAFAPRDVAADGTGAYTLIANGQTVTATRLSTQGPFVWSSGPAQISSLLLPQGAAIFTHLTFDASPIAGVQTAPLITYLECGVV